MWFERCLSVQDETLKSTIRIRGSRISETRGVLITSRSGMVVPYWLVSVLIGTSERYLDMVCSGFSSSRSMFDGFRSCSS